MIGLADTFKHMKDNDEASPMFLPNVAERVFSDKGALVNALGLEHRAGQEEMALSVAQAFATDSTLFVEAPTGVGKSLAYLVPGIIHAMASGRQLLVSTNTKALQEQILKKDLELCRKLFRESSGLGKYADFKAAVLMGKGNYLCGTRLREAMTGCARLFPNALDKELLRIEEWSKSSQHGLIQELAPSPMEEIWEHVNADSPACNNRNCKPETCAYRRARQEVEQANVLIVNHSLLFSLLGAGAHPAVDTPGILHAADFAVLDEAHTVPGVATEHFGVHVSDYAIRRQLLRLHNPTTHKGLLERYANGNGKKEVERALEATREFFASVSDKYLMESDIVRLPTPNWIEPKIQPVLAALAAILSSEAQRIGSGPPYDELKGAADVISAYSGALTECIELEEHDHVYWTERAGRGRIVALQSAPLDVAPYLRESLFRRNTGVVLTSATLGCGDGMDSFVTRTGGNGARLESVASPFDYERQMRVFVAEGAPAPEEGRMDTDWMADIISHCATAIKGGSLVLFTSHRDMRAASVKVEGKCKTCGRPFFMQGRDGSPSFLREEFAKAGNAVLFGTDSFWTGIDVPGAALSQVIVTRLPFENPSHPIAQARAQWHQARGDNPFLTLTLPDAVIKFRQGIGRLIRNKTDLGTLTLLDSRVLTKQYGRNFLSVIPQKSYTRMSRETLAEKFRPLEA
jgi:ATP-dependent DNA helicase DinG